MRWGSMGFGRRMLVPLRVWEDAGDAIIRALSLEAVVPAAQRWFAGRRGAVGEDEIRTEVDIFAVDFDVLVGLQVNHAVELGTGEILGNVVDPHRGRSAGPGDVDRGAAAVAIT